VRERLALDHKPSSVLRNGVVVIYLGETLPSLSSDQPEGMRRATPFPSYLVLLRMGFAELPTSPPGLVSSYLTVSPLSPHTSCAYARGRSAFCGTFLTPREG
jgi:hypothetical protein